MQSILLVEPDATLRAWFQQHLSTQGLVVADFDDGARALEAAQLAPPDLMLVATDLPASGAFALAAGIRSNLRTARIPILFVVPENDHIALAQAISIEPQGVITKPLTHMVLLESVAARLREKDAFALRETQSAPSSHGLGPTGGFVPASVTGSGLLIDARDASVLVVKLRNFVSLARSLSTKILDPLLRQFLSTAREAVVDQGGWIVRADANGLVALFEEGPERDRTHASRAIEAALGVVLAARRTKKWAETAVPNTSILSLSVGCGVHTGEVIVARLSGSSPIALTIAGQTVELAQRLDGRAKGLGWSLAVSGSAAILARVRFHYGRRAELTDTDYDVTIPIAEVLGFNPGIAKPGELPLMAEVSEAVLANTMLARLAGDVDHLTADQTIVVSAQLRAKSEPGLKLPQRRIERKIGHGKHVSIYVALNMSHDREEVVKTLRPSDLPQTFINQYLDEYRKIASVEQRNVVAVLEVGQTPECAYVATEFLSGKTLADAIRSQLAVGLALNYLTQMCMSLDAIHHLGIVHGALRAGHFLFRKDGALVLVDFNTTERLGLSLGLLQPSTDAGDGRAQSVPGNAVVAGTRADYQAVGLILHQMLTGEISPNTEPRESTSATKLFEASRLPLSLSVLQPCLDKLLGIESQAPFEHAEDVLNWLNALKEVFPFDIRYSGGFHASTLGRG